MYCISCIIVKVPRYYGSYKVYRNAVNQRVRINEKKTFKNNTENIVSKLDQQGE